MGITTPLSTNPAMTIGGLTVGVTPLDMAHAYETIAHGGRRVSGSMAHVGDPVGIQEVESPGRPLPDGSRRDKNRVQTKGVLPVAVAQTETSMLEAVLQYGTGRAAAIGQFAAGKTGTTSNYGDAWFVGWDSKYTVAVWVGYPDKLIPMTTDFGGQPVLGGTFPALIWHDFMSSALQIDKARAEHTPTPSGAEAGTSSGASSLSETTSPAPSGGGGAAQNAPSAGNKSPAKPSAPAGAESPASGAGPEHSPTPAPSHEAPSSPETPATPSAPASPSPTGGVGPGG
jgi:penicillin-binding protein 1A